MMELESIMPLTQPVASRGLRSQRKANRQPGGPNPFEVVDDVVDPEDSLMADPFELEMENELEQRAQHAQKAQGWTEPLKGEDLDPGPSSSSASGTYDPIYFDSDDEDHDKDKETESENQPESSLATPSKRKMMSNDELLYDPDQDDRDQAWADSVRKQYLPDQHRLLGPSQSSKATPLPNSDAVLNCPACFNVLCLDCQRHALYETQYRAMFVTNCSVDLTQKLKYPRAKTGSKKKTKALPELEAADSSSDEFHPVKCDHCSTEVAMYDKDEIYHFFNVMASHA